MLDNVGLRYPHRASGAKAPRTLRPLPLLRFAVSATGGAHLCSIQYYLRFWLSSCHTSLAVSALRIMRYCLRRNGQPGRLAPAVFWWDGQAEKSVCKAGEFNPQSVVGIIGWRAHNVRPYGKENTRNRENRASTGVIPFGWVGAPAEEKNTQSWKDRAHEAGGYIVRRLAPSRTGGENERIVNCAPKQHKAEKSVDRHRLFVIYLKNTK